MPAVDHQAVLEVDEISPIMTIAKDTSPLAYSLTAWLYEFGARDSEPGLQLLKDVDMRALRVRPIHLKQGKPPAWHRLLPFCRDALPRWIYERSTQTFSAEQQLYLFPSAVSTGRCYTCKGTGDRPILRRQGTKRFREGTKPCHHCGATGKRWGIARHEVYSIVVDVMERAGVPKGRRHPHVLRHSIITHLLDAGAEPAMVQDRVGHKHLATTLEYARATKRAIDGLEEKLGHIYARKT